MAVVSEKFIFLQAPKCAGSWVRRALNKVEVDFWEEGGEHGIPTSDGWQYKPAFVILRDPLDWYRSYFTFCVENKVRIIEGLDKHIVDFRDDDGQLRSPHIWFRVTSHDGIERVFNQWLRRVLHTCPGFVSALYGYYTKTDPEVLTMNSRVRHEISAWLKMQGVEFDMTKFAAVRQFNVCAWKPRATPENATMVARIEAEAYEMAGVLPLQEEMIIV